MIVFDNLDVFSDNLLVVPILDYQKLTNCPKTILAISEWVLLFHTILWLLGIHFELPLNFLSMPVMDVIILVLMVLIMIVIAINFLNTRHGLLITSVPCWVSYCHLMLTWCKLQQIAVDHVTFWRKSYSSSVRGGKTCCAKKSVS